MTKTELFNYKEPYKEISIIIEGKKLVVFFFDFEKGKGVEKTYNEVKNNVRRNSKANKTLGE